ncbi:MAG: hypothetical protein ACREXU_10745 [Gammaproteobacteria bacterium]
MRYSTAVDVVVFTEAPPIEASVTGELVADIMREFRLEQRPKKKPMATVGTLLDMDLGNEVGRHTPKVKIYRPDPVTGELVLKEHIQATTFRRRVLETIGGQAFQDRIDEMRRKRQKAGARSKAKSRATRKRLGLQPRHPLPLTDDEPTGE